MSERVWWRRLRWRLRGATMWPAFAAGIAVDAVILHLLPIAGDAGPGVVPAVLLATFFNLVVVAIGAPVAGRLLRARQPGLPRVVADDRAGTALLGALAVALLAIGLAHRPSVQGAERDFAIQAASVRRFVLSEAPLRYRANVDRMDTWKQGPELFRTCVPGPDPRRAYCVIVITDRHPPTVRRDRDQRPNARVAGPASPGRQRG